MADFIVAILLVVGGLFGLIGSFGLLKLTHPMRRLHAPTKATTLGVGCVLIASVVFFQARGQFTWHELLIAAFLFLTAPITATFIAKAYMHRSARPGELPPTGTARGWATFDDGGGTGPGDRDS